MVIKKQKIIKKNKFATDDSARAPTLGETVLGLAIATGVANAVSVATNNGALPVLHGAYDLITGAHKEPAKAKPTADVAFDTGKSYSLTTTQIKDLQPEWKVDKNAVSAKFTPNADNTGVVSFDVPTDDGSLQAKVLPVSDANAFMDDAVNIKEKPGKKLATDAHIIPADGHIVLTKEKAQDYAKANLTGLKTDGIAKIDVMVNGYNGIGAAKVFYTNDTPVKIALDQKQANGAIEALAGNITKLVKDKKIKIESKENPLTYLSTMQFVEDTLKVPDQWGLGLEEVIKNAVTKSDKYTAGYDAGVADGFVNGTWSSGVSAYSTHVINLLNASSNASLHAEMSNVSGKIDAFKKAGNANGAIEYLTDLTQKVAQDGMVPTANFNGWVNNADGTWTLKSGFAGYVPGSDVDNATKAVLNSWRSEINDTYSSINGVNYLNKVGINESNLDNANASVLWSFVQQLDNAVVADAKLTYLQSFASGLGIDASKMNEAQIKDNLTKTLGKSEFAKYVNATTGQNVSGMDAGQLWTTLDNYFTGKLNNATKSGYDSALTDALKTNGTAGALLASWGDNGTALEYRMNIIAAHSDRLNYTFTHSLNDTLAFDKFYSNLTANNVTLPLNVSFQYKNNSANIRILDTYGNGGIIALYNGNMMVDARELTSKQMKSVADAAYSAGIKAQSGNVGDE